MKKLLLTTALVMLATPASAKEYIIKEVSDPVADKPYYFEPDHLRIQPGDTVTFVDAQDDSHDVMFVKVPKGVEDMIMSPMMKSEGEKWSYTFTVPGTYQYHCHPHEAAGMKGTLVVGQPSMPGDMKDVDHEALEGHMGGMEGMEHMHGMEHMDNHKYAGGDEPKGMGKINSIDAENRSVNIAHEPIDALKWPAMTMDFPVADDVDLSGFKEGEMVEFTLKSGENNQYSIIEMKESHEAHH